MKKHNGIDLSKDTRSLEQFIKDLANSISHFEVVFLLGAGISVNSGLPLANDLKKKILEKFNFEKGIFELLDKSDIPFEAFMEVISLFDISKLLEIFLLGEPNTNHYLISTLAKMGHVDLVLTTNFDLLLERSFEKIGLINENDFHVFYEENQFLNMNMSEKDQKIKLIKIHGSINKPETVRTILSSVWSKNLSEKRVDVINHVFKEGLHKKIIIMGYSCSDDFDINPAIVAIANSNKEIILIDHSTNRFEIHNISITKGKNPFENFNGKRIVADTNLLIEKLYDLLNIPRETTSPSNVDWQKHVDEWSQVIQQAPESTRYLVASDLFHFIGNSSAQLKCLEKSLQDANNSNNVKDQLLTIPELWVLHNSSGSNEAAHDLYKNFIKVMNRTVLGETKGDDDALEMFERIKLRFITLLGNKVLDSRFWLNYGKMVGIEEGISGPRKSLQLFENAFESINKIENNHIQNLYLAECYLNYGVSLEKIGNDESNEEMIENAKNCYSASAEIAAKMSNVLGEATAYAYLATLYVGNYRFGIGISFAQKALDMARKIKNKHLEARSCLWLGFAYGQLARLSISPTSEIPKLALFLQFGDVVPDFEQNCSLSIQNFEEALRVSTEIGDDVLINAAKHNLDAMINLRKFK